jgi:hypothetical protein
LLYALCKDYSQKAVRQSLGEREIRSRAAHFSAAHKENDMENRHSAAVASWLRFL